MPSNSPAKILAQTLGRRKTASASVRLTSGNGQLTVNGMPVAEYFPGIAAKIRYEQPFKVAQVDKFDATVKVRGGGKISQLEAVILGLARALAQHKSDHRPALRAAKLLTRDSRARQRRMVGTGGKSRRRKQSPKR